VKALRGTFFLLAAAAGCFSDNGVKRDIARGARVLAAVFTLLFIVAETMELLS
jgi:hypothetical protein